MQLPQTTFPFSLGNPVITAWKANRQFADTLKTKGLSVTYKETEGAHVRSVWRNNLNETARVLFAPRR
jgi:enterochelin esterase-like enzyme